MSTALKVKVYHDEDADLKWLKGKKIVVVGYGSQGHGQALNLRDSQMDVKIAVRQGGRGWNLALKHGWEEGKNLLSDVGAAVKDADWVHILVPDESQKDLYDKTIAPNLKKGAVLGFSHGFNIRFGQIVPPKGAGQLKPPCHPPIQDIHKVGDEYSCGGGDPPLLNSGQDGKKSKGHIGHREKIGHHGGGLFQLLFWLNQLVHLAMTVSPPRTRVPCFTTTSTFVGNNKSTWDPKRMSPIRSPCFTSCPSLAQHNTRRAIKPAIWVTTTSPLGLLMVKAFCSFLIWASGSRASKNVPLV
jgi:hypothetical protein